MRETVKKDKVKEYYPIIYKYVLVRLGNNADVQDIVQEAMCQYWQSEVSFPDEHREKAWLFTVASNLCKNYWRSGWRKNTVLVKDSDILDSPAPDVLLEQVETREVLLKSVQSLPVKYREVIYLYYYENMSVYEISQITGKKESTIQTQLERGRNRLKGRREVKSLRIKGLVLPALIAIGCISSLSVYAYSQIGRTVHQTEDGIVITASEDLYTEGETLAFEVKPLDAEDSESRREAGSRRENYGDAVFEFTSWEEAEDYLPFTVVYPDIEELVSCGVQPGMNTAWAVYETEDFYFSLSYLYFPSKNWTLETDYDSGEITAQEYYTNQYGYTFSLTDVLLDKTNFVYAAIAFEHYYIRLDFEDTDISKIHEILDLLDFEILG